MMIGILALMIPIIAILVHSPVGKAYAHKLLNESQGNPEEVALLKSQLASLQQIVLKQQEQLETLQDDLRFQQKLLEEKSPAPKTLETKQAQSE